jgi:nucleoside-diphosphate-sugar epimerase
MKVFLTGGTGVIGRPTVAKLIEVGHTVRAAARRDAAAEQLRDAGAEPVALDLFDAAAVRDALVGSEAVLHIATNVPPMSKMARPKAWTTHNRLRTEATRNLVDAAREAGVRKLVKESITFIYADGGDAWLDESSPLIPELGLLAPTVDGEQIALELADGDAETVVLRFGLFYGGVGNRATDEMLRLARWRGSMVAGQADAFMSSVHADDAAAAVIAALDVPSGIYNVTDDEPLTRRAALDAFAAAFDTKKLRTNPHWAVRLLAGSGGAALTASQRVSNQKLRTAAGWAPSFPSLREGYAFEAARRAGQGATSA